MSSSLASVAPEAFSFVPSGNDSMSYHDLEYKSVDDVIFLTLTPGNEGLVDAKMRIYFLFAARYDNFCVLG